MQAFKLLLEEFKGEYKHEVQYDLDVDHLYKTQAGFGVNLPISEEAVTKLHSLSIKFLSHFTPVALILQVEEQVSMQLPIEAVAEAVNYKIEQSNTANPVLNEVAKRAKTRLEEQNLQR